MTSTRLKRADAFPFFAADKYSTTSLQAFDEGPWPRMSGRHRGTLMKRLADLMEVGWPRHNHSCFRMKTGYLAETNYACLACCLGSSQPSCLSFGHL